MMDSEDQSIDEAHIYASKEEMENHDPLSRKSSTYSNYRSAMSSFKENRHPFSPSIAVTPADSDPLLSPLDYTEFGNPSSHDNSYIDPPSYGDAIFSPFNDNNGNGNDVNVVDSPSHSSDSSMIFSRSNSSSEYLKITVSNPVKEYETSNSIVIVPGSNTYFTYLITTRTNIAEFGASEFSVRRRFRDVVTLSDRLAESYRGFFIPPRPDKSVVESQVMQKQEFVEQRRVALEKYLRRLAAHPVVRKSDEFKVFLQVQGRLPLPATVDVASRVIDGAVKLPKQLLGDSVIPPNEVVQPAKGGRDFMRLLKEFKQSMVNDWGSSKSTVVEEDREFLEKKEKIQALEIQITNASKQAESLVKSQHDMADALGGLGLALLKLTKFENEEAVLNSQRVRAADTRSFATGAVKASRFQRESNAQTMKHLDTLHEYLGLMLAVQGAFSDRSSALLTVQTLISELSSLQSRAEKLEAASSKVFGGDKSRNGKLQELKETIRVTEDAKHVATREYERIKENNRTELERLDRERQADFLNMLKGFVVSQVGYAEKIADVWTKVAEDTSKYVNDDSS